MGIHKIPDRYPFAEEVPKEGTSCANCYFLGKDGKTCRNKIYIKKNGSNQLGKKASRWCCMVWSLHKRT